MTIVNHLAILTVRSLLLNQSTAQVPVKSNFEDWSLVLPIPFDEPDCWNTTNPHCTSLGLDINVALTDDATDGSYALLLETGTDSFFTPFPSVATYKNKITYRPDQLTGFYKADLQQDDFSRIRISFLSDRGTVGWGHLDFLQSTTIYKPFEIPITYISPDAIPDSFFISIFSSSDYATTGTILIIDELALVTLVDVTEPLSEKFTTKLSPNPATDDLLVELPKDIGEVIFRAYDANGILMENQTFQYQIRIDVSDYTAGLYIFEIRYKTGEIYDKGRFRVGEHKF